MFHPALGIVRTVHRSPIPHPPPFPQVGEDVLADGLRAVPFIVEGPGGGGGGAGCRLSTPGGGSLLTLACAASSGPGGLVLAQGGGATIVGTGS